MTLRIAVIALTIAMIMALSGCSGTGQSLYPPQQNFNRGVNAFLQKEYGEAERLLERAVAEAEDFGREDRIGFRLCWLSRAYMAQDKRLEALSSFRRSFAAYKSYPGILDWSSIMQNCLIEGLPDLLYEQGNFAEAESALTWSMQSYRRAWGDDLSSAFEKLAEGYDLQGKRSEADEARARADKIRQAAREESRRIAEIRAEARAAEEAAARAPSIARPTLRQALAAPVAALAEGYLATRRVLSTLILAKGGGQVETIIDGTPQIINQNNAMAWNEALDDRLHVYSMAITQRGFAEIDGRYHVDRKDECGRLGFSQSEIVIRQNEFRVELPTDSLVAQGVVVKSVVAIESALNPEIVLEGNVSKREIHLVEQVEKAGLYAYPSGKPASRCELTLVRH